MEKEGDVSSTTGVLVPVSENSEVFKNSILAPLQSAYLFEESKQSFRYKSGFLIKNPALEEKYNAYRAKKRDLGYLEEELKETYGFLLFDELGKANAVGEAGVLTRNGTCSTLGDPSKGVYLSMYSDCLDLNRWYHGKSGYIAIFRLTQGRVKKVLENYTQNFTTPTVGFDCHVSEQLPTVSSKTSSFLAFERTQYYMYELLDSGSSKTSEAPSLVCPFAIVAFSYTDTKATTETTEEKSQEKNVAFPYLAWTGQLQLGTQFHSVGLRSTAGSLVRAKLPPVVKVERAISMLDLRQLLPRAAFETSFSGEAFLDGLYCSLCELTVSVVEENSSFSQLLQEIKYKDLAFVVPLDDGGFLILLHSSHFFMYENDTESNSNVLQGMFVFPDSQVTQRDTKFEPKKLAIPSDIQRALPLLTYAEGEVEKTLLNPSKERNKIIVQHMQSYAALINPVLELSPFRDVSIFLDQYDVPDAHRHLYASPEWTDQSWQSFRSYLNKPVSFQVPVLTASGILAAGQEDRREDLEDDVYICLSSPEEACPNFINKASEEQVDQRSPDTETSPAEAKSPAADAKTFLAEVETSLAVFKTSLAEVETSLAEVETSLAEVATSLGDTETSLGDTETSLGDAETSIADAETSLADAGVSQERCTTNMEKQRVVTAVPQHTVAGNFQDGEGKTSLAEMEKSGLKNVLIPPISNDLPAELIVSITSAAQTVSEEDLTVISTASATKLNDCQLSVSSMEKLQMEGLNSLNDKVVKTKQILECAEAQNPTKPHWRKQCKGHPRVQKKGSKHCTEIRRLLPHKVVPVKHYTGNVRRAKRKFENLTSKREAGEEKLQDSPKDMLENTILKELEAYSLRKKTERWDLKPVISECGRILVPHGTLDITDEVKSLKEKLWSLTVEQCSEKMLVDAPVHAGSMVEMEQQSSDVSEMPQGKTAVQDHLLDTFSSMKCPREETMLTKLKSVLFRSKRKGDPVRSEKPDRETASNSEVCPKRIRSDLDTEMLKSNNAVPCVQDTNVCVQEVSKMLSVDLVFAQALGLTPKENPDKLQKAVGHKDQQRKDSPETQEQSIVHKQPQIILQPPSIFPRRSRIKMLKKHQSVPAEHIRSKWWLHFQTPACFDTEKLKYKECARDISVRKTVKERMQAACSPTDALNLLADLALSANKDQVPPQPAQALATKPESSLKNCDLTKDVTSPETESFLHALLRQPAARPIQPLEPPSPSPVLGGSELVDLVSVEHAYSLPPSSSLLLGLPGTPFQVSPLSGSTRLLLHPQQKYGDGTQTLQPSVYLEEKVELNQRTPGWLKKCTRRRKFRHSRTFVNKDGTVQVTRQWEENYDFKLDSRFTVDSLDKAVNRALHGPWDLSMYDTTEEVQLIIHMWIGLFYSRSTARLFHLDPNFTFSPSDDNDGLETSSGKTSDALHSEFVSNGPVPSATDTSVSQALDLSKNSNSVLDQGSVLLDLSMKTTDAVFATLDPKVSNKHLPGTDEQKGLCETQNASKPSLGLHEASPFQCYRNMVHSNGIVRKVNDSRSIHAKQRTCVPSQKDDCLGQTDKSSSENDRISVGGGKENVSIQLPSVPPAVEINNMLHGSCNEREGFDDGMENSDTTKMSLAHKTELDLKKVVTCDEVKSNSDPRIELHSVEHYENVSKDGENFEMKDDPHHRATVEDSSTVICTDSNSTNKKSDVVCSERVFENETKHLKAHSPCWTENATEDNDCTAHKSKVIGDGNCFEKDKFNKDLETGCDLGDQPLSVICNGPDSVKDTEVDCQAQVTEEQLQADSRSACEDLPFKSPCTNDNVLPEEHAVSENSCLNKEHVNRETATETNSENICLSDKATYKNSTTCLDVFKAGKPSTQMDNLEPVIQAELAANLNMHNEEDIKSVREQQKVDNTTQEPLDHQAHVFQDEVLKNLKAEVAMTDEISVRYEEESKGLWNTHGRVIIPFIGVDTSFEDIIESQFSDPKWKVQGKEAIPFISTPTGTEMILLTEANGASHVDSEPAQRFCGKMPLNASDTKGRAVCKESGSDDRCPTPTIDERPYRYAFSDPRDASNSVIHRDITLKDHSRSSTPVMDEKSLEPNSILSDTFCEGVKSDLELRTLRVLQSVDEFLSTLPHTNESSQNKTPGTQHSLEQTPSSSIKCKPTHSSPNNISALASTSQELHTESPEDGFTLSFTNKFEEVLGVKLQFKKMNSAVHHTPNFEQAVTLQETSVQQDDSTRLFSSSACLQTIRTNDAEDRPNAKSNSNLGNEPCSTSHRPVMAVKPSKSDETQRDFIPKDGSSEQSTSSKNAETKIPEGKVSTPRYMVSVEKTSFKTDGQNVDHQEASELSFKDISTSSDRKLNLNKDTFLHCHSFYQQQHMHSSTVGTPASSVSVQFFNPTSTASKHVDRHQNLRSFAKKVGAKKYVGEDPDDCLQATSFVDYKTNKVTDDTLIPGTQTSLLCTVHNTDGKSSSFLEQVSSRCLQEDPTQASMDQECLIFSEQMKQLLKRQFSHQQVPMDKSELPCIGPMTVHFSSLDEQDDSSEDFEVLPSLVGQKIKVDMFDRNQLRNGSEEKGTLQLKKISFDTRNPVDKVDVSAMTEECTRLYKDMMDDICSGLKVSSTTKNSQMDGGYPKQDPGNYFHFCSQMKRELDESFRSHLNSVVKKSCKTKYRFFMLVTSDNAFFEETKIHLEAEGHTAVHPSKFFLDEDSPSLLIIIRNEDIAEHIYEVPYLLELKMSKGVRFVGIDEPDDIVNLTHQELFNRGGFVMFDGAALDSLSLCNVKKLANILQELSQTGKWKWFMHYRESRRLKENARLCTEAKEKKHFLNKCQEEGLLELLPYHECDLMSRQQPDHLTCLCHLQVQNISARYPVFVTDTTTDNTFGRNGILTMTVNSFLMNSVNILT